MLYPFEMRIFRVFITTKDRKYVNCKKLDKREAKKSQVFFCAIGEPKAYGFWTFIFTWGYRPKP